MAHPPYPTIDEHYTTVMFDTENEDDLRKIIQPPSTVLKEKFSDLGDQFQMIHSKLFQGMSPTRSVGLV